MGNMWLLLANLITAFLLIMAHISTRIDIGSKNKFILGGLFPVHQRGKSEQEPCGQILLEKGVQRLEAMLFAIDQINSNKEYWKFNIGAIILDTCSSDSYALEQSLQFLQMSCSSNSSNRKVTGIIGASNSAVSESVANIFRLFKMPQVSYASTSEVLDDLYKYPYFFRVVPSDKFQLQVILDLLIYFNWTYISAIAAEGEYGEEAIKNLQELVTNVTTAEICFAETHILPRNPLQEDYEHAVMQLFKHQKAKVVIVFLNEDKVKNILTTTRRLDIPKKHFVWLGSDGWGTKINPVRSNEEYAEEAITILPKRFPVQGFDEHFLSLKPATNTRNPWFKEFWENQFHCSFDAKRTAIPLCSGEEQLGEYYYQEGLVPMVIDSVMLIATAIKSLCSETKDLCKDGDEKDTKFRRLLKDHIANVKFNSSQGHNIIIRFDEERNIPAHYKIYQYQKNNKGKFDYNEIGEWIRSNQTRLKIQEKVVWNEKNTIPLSTCSDECDTGKERIVNRDPKKRCCWTCRPCDDEEYLPDVKGHCTLCPAGSISNAQKTFCNHLELEYLGRDLRSPWALVPFSFSVFGLICTAVVLVVFLLHHKTPIIMAAGRELCYVILIGVALCYAFTFVVLCKPSEVSCGILRSGMGLGLAICYSAIFTKTNRISRIFNRSIRIAKRPSYISPESQLVICSCLILIQVILTVMWLIIRPPTVRQFTFMNPRAYVSLCGFDGTSVILGLLYNMILIILCTFYAYKTRNIPENFNESKYISFTMYASCIVWLAFIPIYCSSVQDFRVQSTVLCMSVSVSGSVTLACLFLPKMYIVLLHPEKNVRYPSSSPNSSTAAIYTNPVRFVRSNQNSPMTPHKIPGKISHNIGDSDNFLSLSTSNLNSKG